VLFNPVLDLRGIGRKVTGAGGEDLTKEVSPTLQLTADLPPTILFYGTNDRFTSQGREFTRRSRELENHVELHTASGQPHGFFNRSPWMELTLRRADGFLESLGYLKGPPTVDVPEEPQLTKE
jgi:acetyl esterase/lipase